MAAGVAGGGLALASAPSCGRTDNVGGLDAGRLDADAEASADSRVAFDAGFGPLYGGPAPYDAGSDEGCMGGCTDFPSSPLNDPTAPVPGDPSMLFPGNGETGTTKDGPCLSEPANGALYPYNWLRPRVLWTAPANQTAFEVRIRAPGEKNDYVVYTTNHSWALDEATWQAIAGVEGGAIGTLVGIPISVTVRGTSGAGGSPTISNMASIEIAPASAGGAIVYATAASFAVSATSTTLQGFLVGDEGTTTALTAPQVQQQVWAELPDGGGFPIPPAPAPVGCIGCHMLTPDGVYVGFTAQWPWPNVLASVQAASPGAAPPWLTLGAMANLSPNANDSNTLGGASVTATNNVDNVMLGIQTFSSAHYATGDRVEITSVGASMDDANDASATPAPACQGGAGPCVVSQLAWINLEWQGGADAGDRPSAAPAAPSNGGWGILARTGDTNSAAAPNWSNDGKTIAYTSVDQGTMDGRLYRPLAGTSADIKTIPYGFTGAPSGNGGGPATSLPGASSASLNEYFPAFSPDDSLVAFNAIPAADTMYDQPAAEVYVVPFNHGDGGTPVRLVANDPIECTGLTSPGVQNTWPKWAPNPIAGDAGASAPRTINGYTYYWITFSSTRSITAGASPGTPGKQQLYVAGIIVDSMGHISTYAPIYLWNQDNTVNNLIPAWTTEAPVFPCGDCPPPPPPPPPPNME